MKIILIIMVLSFAVGARPIKIYNDYPGKTIPVLTTARVREAGQQVVTSVWVILFGFILVSPKVMR